MRIRLILLFLSCLFNVAAQKNPVKTLDSLRSLVSVFKTDSLRIDALHKQFFRFIYADPKVAKEIANFTLRNTTEKKTPYLFAQSLIRKGIYYDVISKTDSAMYYYDLAYKVAAPRKDYFSMGNVYNDKGLIYWNNNDLERAMREFIKGAKVFKKINNQLGLSSIYNNMGLLFSDLNRYNESKSFHLKAMRLRLALRDTLGLGSSYSNLSATYEKLNIPDSAVFYMRKSIEVKKQTNDLRGLGIDYENLGFDFKKNLQLDSAIYYTKKAQELFDQTGDRGLGAKNLTNLAEIYRLNNQFLLALKTIQRALSLTSKADVKQLAGQETILAKILFGRGEFRGSSEAYARAFAYMESYKEIQRTAQAQEYYEKYQSAEKEAEIAKQKQQIAQNDLLLEKRNNTIYSLLAVSLILLSIGLSFYRQQNLKSTQREKENELKLALAAIETQNKLHEQRLRISRDLHDNVGSQLTFLISSLDNLKLAQNVQKEAANQKLTELSRFTRTTMEELRDTIWAINKNEISLADITDRAATLIAQFNSAGNGEMSLETNFQNVKNPIFSAIQGMHIFRIIQEAVNNAVKYSNAPMIQVSSHYQSSSVVIEVSDNGQGYDTGKNRSGNGLKNMIDRAKLIGADFHISSQVGIGTKIKLILSENDTE